MRHFIAASPVLAETIRPKAVMPGLDPGIHLLQNEMDCRVKPGNDE
jgi:hypothetical protein